jgi:hypothetical protein
MLISSERVIKPEVRMNRQALATALRGGRATRTGTLRSLAILLAIAPGHDWKPPPQGIRSCECAHGEPKPAARAVPTEGLTLQMLGTGEDP